MSALDSSNRLRSSNQILTPDMFDNVPAMVERSGQVFSQCPITSYPIDPVQLLTHKSLGMLGVNFTAAVT